MAKKGTGQISQIIDIPAIEKQVGEVLELMKTVSSSIESVATAVSKLYKEAKDAKSIGELATATEKVTEAKNKLTADEKALQQLEQRRVSLLARLKVAETENAKEVEHVRQSLQKRNRELQNQVKQEKAVTDSINGMRAKLIEMRTQYDALAKAERNTPFGEELRKNILALNNEILELEKSTGRAQRNVGNYASALQGLGKNVLAAFGLVTGIRGVINVFTSGIRTIKDFEQANANLASILGKSRSEIEVLTDSAKFLGATTEYTASQITVLQTELAKLGFEEGQILQMTKPISQFATALGADLGDAAAVAGAALRAFQLDASETTRVVSALAVGANKSALDFNYFEGALSTVSPVANAFNFTIEDTVALLGTLANSGFDASSAATATRNILLNLADSSGKLATALGKPIKSLDELAPALIKLRDSGIDLNETLELTDKRSVAAFNTFLSNAESLTVLRDSITGVNDELKRMQEERLDTLEGSIKLLESAWEGLILQFSESTGVIRIVVDWLADLLTGINMLFERANELSYQREGLIPKGWVGEAAKDVQKDIDNYIKTVSALPEYAGKAMSEIAEEAGVVVTENLKNALSQAQYAYDILKQRADDLEAQYGSIRIMEDAIEQAKEDANIQLVSLKIIQEKVNAANSYTKELKEQKAIAEDTATTDRKKAETEKERLKRLEKERKEREEILKIQREIEALEAKAFIDERKETAGSIKNSYDTRIIALQNYGVLRIEEIDNQLNYELKAIETSKDAEELKAVKVTLAYKKAEAEKQKLIKETAQIEEKINSDTTKKAIAAINARMAAEQSRLNELEDQELLELADRYAATNLKQEEYERTRTEITLKYRLQSYDFEMDLLQNELLALATTEEEKEAILQKFRDLKIEREKAANDKIIADRELYVETEKQLFQELYSQLQAMQQEAFNFASILIDARYEKQFKALNKESEAVDKALTKEIKLINKSIDTEEEKQRRIGLAEERAALQKEALAEKESEIRRRQAQSQRALNIATIIMDGAAATAKVIMTAAVLSSNPVTASLAALAYAQIPVIATTNALQIAAVLAAPLPTYAEGGKHKQDGPGIVGDAGKNEVIETPDGRFYITPKVPTIVSIPRNSIIYPDINKATNIMDAIPEHTRAFSDVDILASILGIKLDRLTESVEANSANIYIDGNVSALVNINKKLMKRQAYKHKMLN